MTIPPGRPAFAPDDTVDIGMGETEFTVNGVPDSGDYVAVLWLIDPEQRHFLREYYVKKQTAPKPGSRPMGYRRNG